MPRRDNKTDVDLGIVIYMSGSAMTPVQIDTSADATDTIAYVVTDQSILEDTATQTVIVQTTASSVVSADASSTNATSNPTLLRRPKKDENYEKVSRGHDFFRVGTGRPAIFKFAAPMVFRVGGKTLSLRGLLEIPQIRWRLVLAGRH
jgi:hypothetical protein